MTCSTPSSTSARPRSSRRPGARGASPSPPTWPAAGRTSCSAATPSFSRAARWGRSRRSRRSKASSRRRAGPQGDPGSSKFYLSLEDDLMRIFASDRISKLMETFGVKEDEPIEHPWLTKAIEGAQQRVEGQNFDIRKNLLEYDDVMNQQRRTVYALRRQILEGRYQQELSEEEVKAGKEPTVPQVSGDWTIDGLKKKLQPEIEERLNR